MKKVIYLLLISTLVFNSCSTLKIEKINASSEIKKTGFVYALPETKLNIEFTAIKTKYIKGPFNEYSKEYLGIKNVITEEKTNYQISSIKVSSQLQNDTSQIYLVTGKSKEFNSFQYFDNSIVLKSINITEINDDNKNKNKYFLPQNKTENELYIPYKDITIRPLVIEKNDTIWKNILVDSVYKRVPKINKAIAPSTIKDQAFDASKFIFKIRKRRLRILAGMDEKYPQGDALKKILKELDNLEESYIELFTGKTISDKIKYSFSFVPNETSTEFVINFDNKSGFSQESVDEIKINIEKAIENKTLKNIEDKEKSKKLFTYRLAENAILYIEYNNSIIYKTEIPISQFGYVNYLNKNILNKEILFNKATGNLILIK